MLVKKWVLAVIALVWLGGLAFFGLQSLRLQKETKALQTRQQEYVQHRHQLHVQVSMLSQDIQVMGGSGETCKIVQQSVDGAHREAQVKPTYHRYLIECVANSDSL